MLVDCFDFSFRGIAVSALGGMLVLQTIHSP